MSLRKTAATACVVVFMASPPLAIGAYAQAANGAGANGGGSGGSDEYPAGTGRRSPIRAALDRPEPARTKAARAARRNSKGAAAGLLASATLTIGVAFGPLGLAGRGVGRGDPSIERSAGRTEMHQQERKLERRPAKRLRRLVAGDAKPWRCPTISGPDADRNLQRADRVSEETGEANHAPFSGAEIGGARCDRHRHGPPDPLRLRRYQDPIGPSAPPRDHGPNPYENQGSEGFRFGGVATGDRLQPRAPALAVSEERMAKARPAAFATLAGRERDPSRSNQLGIVPWVSPADAQGSAP